MIVSESFSECELFLTASSDSDKINEAYYVKLSPCPTGFTLQNGVRITELQNFIVYIKVK